ncbi:TraR/DksA C4-type zinc finger protein [Tepidimicrobium xylanilyticum]|uniref:Transcriptional regulator, TraR/DksA family n=1 Tax=Tepidimicrobium xylanilyticum TaxID=1123352 RepID=A0A1H2YSR6_9FIRM|nr:TraR/DksA C4-type zinc finger protein [Tepidimicrobium xylanilyticum]SDX08117.1 transcriptional regulator, TraR/DksA family [Tepidimicrobium xylanilyticum]
MGDYEKGDFLGRLEYEKKRILDILDKMKNNGEFGAMDEYYTELSSYDNHPADLGTEMFVMEHEKGLIDQLQNTLNEIEESIKQLEGSDYGKCQVCGRKIDEERLRVIPYTKLCINCANSKIPLDRKRQFRPEEEDSISPFSKSHKEGNQFDREDSYQEVARYNKVESDPSFSTGDDLGIYDEEDSGVVEDVEKISEDYSDKVKE